MVDQDLPTETLEWSYPEDISVYQVNRLQDVEGTKNSSN